MADKGHHEIFWIVIAAVVGVVVGNFANKITYPFFTVESELHIWQIAELVGNWLAYLVRLIGAAYLVAVVVMRLAKKTIK